MQLWSQKLSTTNHCGRFTTSAAHPNQWFEFWKTLNIFRQPYAEFFEKNSKYRTALWNVAVHCGQTFFSFFFQKKLHFSSKKVTPTAWIVNGTELKRQHVFAFQAYKFAKQPNYQFRSILEFSSAKSCTFQIHVPQHQSVVGKVPECNTVLRQSLTAKVFPQPFESQTQVMRSFLSVPRKAKL